MARKVQKWNPDGNYGRETTKTIFKSSKISQQSKMEQFSSWFRKSMD